jgi:hypothetical protein
MFKSTDKDTKRARGLSGLYNWKKEIDSCRKSQSLSLSPRQKFEKMDFSFPTLLAWPKISEGVPQRPGDKDWKATKYSSESADLKETVLVNSAAVHSLAKKLMAREKARILDTSGRLKSEFLKRTASNRKKRNNAER